jgi:hypothetical protein
MPFNVQEFKARGLELGGARPSLFEVTMQTPRDVGRNGEREQLKFLARAAQIPAMTVDPIEVPYFGRKIKLAGDRTFADWTITIMNDEDFAIRSMFENWSNKLNALVSNRNSAGTRPEDYKVEAFVHQYGKAGRNSRYQREDGIIRSYKFVGAFPTTIDAIALDWDNTNAIQTFDVTFSYDYWEPEHFGGGETYQARLTV